MYGSDWDRTDYGLKGAPEIRHGYILGNFDQNAVSLEEWIGEDFAFYYDAHYEGYEDYMPLAPPASTSSRRNWKIGVDQNTGDAYHALGTHKTMAEAGSCHGRPAQHVRRREGHLPRLRPHGDGLRRPFGASARTAPEVPVGPQQSASR